MTQEIISYVQSLSSEPINKKSMVRKITDYRHLTIFLIRLNYPKLSYRKIVKLIDFHNHSIVGYVCKKIEGRMKVDSKFRKYVETHIENVSKLTSQPS